MLLDGKAILGICILWVLGIADGASLAPWNQEEVRSVISSLGDQSLSEGILGGYEQCCRDSHVQELAERTEDVDN